MNRYTSILLLAVALISVSCATAEKPWYSKGEEGNKSAASKPNSNHRISPNVNMHLSYEPKPMQTSRRLPEDNKEDEDKDKKKEEAKKDDEKKGKDKDDEVNSAALEDNAALSSYRVTTTTAFALAATGAMIF